jgi:hypothetical protein
LRARVPLRARIICSTLPTAPPNHQLKRSIFRLRPMLCGEEACPDLVFVKPRFEVY